MSKLINLLDSKKNKKAYDPNMIQNIKNFKEQQ